jgi:putative DNA primase/helicase
MGKGKNMTFDQFAREHGLLIDSIVMGRWIRVATEDHPRKRNGAYIFDGRSGLIQNHAVHLQPIRYVSSEPFVPDPMAAVKRQNQRDDQIRRQIDAARKAAFIFNNVTVEQHPYLIRKGFTEPAKVWKGLLAVPMRVDSNLIGLQLIQPDGTKRFLTGQRTKGASLTIDNKGPDVLVEGLATGLSVRRALKLARVRYKIHICFSAGNMLEIAKSLDRPIVVADNDPMGIATAKKIASRYWVGEAGEDFNDYEQRVGSQAAAESLAPFIQAWHESPA